VDDRGFGRIVAAVTSRRILVSGRVQGVAFRAHTAAEARALGLSGWVRNLRDGRVELVAQGPAAAVDALEAWCRVGPSLARVDGIESFEHRQQAGLEGFEIAATGPGSQG